MYQPQKRLILILRNTVSKNLIMSHGILVLSAAIAGITLDGVDDAVFAFLYDADMIGLPILRTGAAFIVPIEENNLTRRRFKAAVLPLPTIFEPLDTVDAACEFRNNAAVDISSAVDPAEKEERSVRCFRLTERSLTWDIRSLGGAQTICPMSVSHISHFINHYE